LTGHYLDVTHFRAELRVLDADSVLAFIEGRVGLPEESRVQGCHHRVVERQDFDSGVGHGLLGLGFDDDRNQTALARSGLEIARHGQQRSED